MTPEESKEHPSLVLIVDDDPTMRLLARAALEGSGFSVAEAASGVEALSAYEELSPELILMDVIMPDMDGFETCAELRRRQGGSVPILMLTALDDIESINRAYETGATDFVTKPINWLILGHRIRYMLRASRTADDLRRSEARNLAILNAIPDLMICVSREGLIREVRGAQILPLADAAEKCKDKSIREVLHPGLAELVAEHMDGVLNGDEIRFFECQVGGAEGVRFFEARIVSGGVEEVLLMVRDITARKQMEEELLRAKKLESLGILAGGIAHDFNNLLSVIQASISLVQMDLQPGAPQAKDLAVAEEAVLRARNLTKKFIVFSGGGAPYKKPVCVKDLVLQAVETVPSEPGIVWKYSLPHDLWQVEVDQGQIRQVLQNVLTNAVEAMGRGGCISIHAENMRSRSMVAQNGVPLHEGYFVKISIRDEGIGIPEGNLHRVFDPYYSTKERGVQKGMGLGLAVAHSVMKRHEGHISIESVVNIGTTVHLYLPATIEQEEQAA